MRKNSNTKVLPSTRLVGATEIAEHLGISVSTVWRWMTDDADFRKAITVRREVRDRRVGIRRMIETTTADLARYEESRPKMSEVRPAKKTASA